MIAILVLFGLAFIGALFWIISQPGWDSIIAAFTTLAAFIGAWYGNKKSQKRINQTQFVSKRGIGIQSGGNVEIGNIHIKGKSKK